MKTTTLKAIDEINEISNPFIQDLLWLIYLPSLESDTIPEQLIYKLPQNDLPDLIDWYNEINPSDIPTMKTYLPLGKYAEKLMEFYFRFSNEFQLLESNLQLTEDSITIGELDYLFKEKATEQFIHLEFAIKYYLKIERFENTIFLGPSTKDWMQRKLDKLIQIQTKHCVKNKTLLPKKYREFEFKPKLLLKGALFYPFGEKSSFKLNEGWWCSIREIEKIQNEDWLYTLITKKELWLFPFRKSTQAHIFWDLKKMSSALLESRNEIMVVRINENRQFADRGFIVRAKWPD